MSALPLVGILIVGAALRLYRIDAESVWLDEAFSITIARTSIPGILEHTALDVHPPLYYLLLFYWGKLAGTTPAAARLLSAILGLGLVAAGYAVARRLLDRPTALVAAALLACAPFQIEFSQEARMYTLLALLSTISMHAFLALLERRSRAWTTTLAFGNALLLYTHTYGAFIIAAQAALLFTRRGRDGATDQRVRATWLKSLAVTLVIYAPWLAIFVLQSLRVQDRFWIAQPSWHAFLHPVLIYAGSAPLAGGLLLAALGGVYRLRREPHCAAVAKALMGWTTAPIALPFLLSFVGSPIFLPKYSIAASVPYAIVAAHGLAGLRGRRWRRAAAAVLLLLTTYGLYSFYTKPRKNDWRRATARLEATARPNDLVVFHPRFQQIPFDFYRQRDDLVRRPLTGTADALPAAEIPAAVARVSAGRNRLWLVALRGEPVISAVVDELNKSFVPVDRAYANGVETILFERR